jgi:hypothetical protein
MESFRSRNFLNLKREALYGDITFAKHCIIFEN